LSVSVLTECFGTIEPVKKRDEPLIRAGGILVLMPNQRNRQATLCAVMVAAIVVLPLELIGAADGRQGNKTGAKGEEPGGARDAVLHGRVTDDAGAPLTDVRVRVAIPGTDMRHVDSRTHCVLETKSVAKGYYRLKIPGVTKPTTVSIDAMKPGYRRLVGTFMSGGDETSADVAPGRTTSANLALKETSLYFAGAVVDEKGKPIEGVFIQANADTENSSGGIEAMQSKADGSFELFNYPVEPFKSDEGATRGAVSFFHPDYIERAIEDVYGLAAKDRTALRIVLAPGRTIAGTVLDVAGKPVPRAMITVVGNDKSHRKGALTEANGKFTLRGLAEGPATLSARALEIKQKVQMAIGVDGDQNDLEVRLQTIPYPRDLKKYSVLGMQLADVTPELKAAYDLYQERGALILDPGMHADRLHIGPLAEGCNFFMVGESWIGSVREFVMEILSQTARQSAGPYSVGVIYSFKLVEGDGNTTQRLKLTDDDLKQLQGVLDQLNVSERESVAALRKAGAQFKVRKAGPAGPRGKDNEPEVDLVVLSKKWNGGDADLQKVAAISTLRSVYVAGAGRVGEKSLDELRRVRPDIAVVLVSEASLGVAASATKQTSQFQIGEILKNSAAERAGLRVGDVLLELAGKPVSDIRSVQAQLVSLKPGQKVPVKLIREGKTLVVTVELGEWD